MIPKSATRADVDIHAAIELGFDSSEVAAILSDAGVSVEKDGAECCWIALCKERSALTALGKIGGQW